MLNYLDTMCGDRISDSLHFFGSLPGGDGRASFTAREQFAEDNREIYSVSSPPSTFS